MKTQRSLIVISSLVVIVLAFCAGMWLNFFSLFKFIDAGETWRLVTDIDEFCFKFFPENGCELSDSVQTDSLMKLDPYVSGNLLVMDSNARIVCAKNGESGNGFEVVEREYGRRGVDLLKAEIESPSGRSKMDYDWNTHNSLYASYEPTKNQIFFYAIDYRVAGKDLYKVYHILLIFMAVCGLALVFICHFLFSVISGQEKREYLVNQEIETAARIQKSMLPRGRMHLLQIDVDARLIPARKVGGDFFCYVLRDGLLYFCIGDVSGKGIPASLFMSKAVTLFRTCANAGLSVKNVATQLNSELCVNNDQNMFLTGIVGIMCVTNGRIKYVNAGHEPPLIWDGKSDSDPGFLSSSGNIPFGVMPDVEFKEDFYEIAANGFIMFYTDGVSEARSRKRSLMGRDILPGILKDAVNLSSKQINDRLMETVSAYESGAEQSDDITLLTFSNKANPKELLLKNDISELKKIGPFLSDIFKECVIDPEKHVLLRSGLDEALTNCVHYAYDAPGQDIFLTASIEDGRLCFTIRDSGIPFDPLSYTPSSSEELKVGGLGISMYRRIFDDVRYSRQDGYNILKLIKTF